MAGAHGGVADLQAVDNPVGLLPVLDAIINLIEGPAGPAFRLIEFPHHGSPRGIPADLHGDEAGREKRAFLVAVDFFENQPQHGSIDQGFMFFLDVFGAFAGKVVGIQKREEIMKGVHVAGGALAGVLLQHRGCR